MSNNAIISRNKCEKISCLFFRELNNTMKITETNRGKSDRKNAGIFKNSLFTFKALRFVDETFLK